MKEKTQKNSLVEINENVNTAGKTIYTTSKK